MGKPTVLGFWIQLQLNQTIEKWISRAGYDAGKLLRA